MWKFGLHYSWKYVVSSSISSKCLILSKVWAQLHEMEIHPSLIMKTHLLWPLTLAWGPPKLDIQLQLHFKVRKIGLFYFIFFWFDTIGLGNLGKSNVRNRVLKLESSDQIFDLILLFCTRFRLENRMLNDLVQNWKRL